jgi:ABC-type Zn uptake system ZnuABC Zn-binding protein ZnuA
MSAGRRLWLLAALCLLLAPAPAAAAQRLRVVATLSTFADLVREIGGEQVEVERIASPRFDPHSFEPKPSDVLKLKRADLFVHGGLDLELWRDPLLEAAGNPRLFPGQRGELDLSRGVRLLEVPSGPVSRLAGDIHLFGNPHYWLDPRNARGMAQLIAEKLIALDAAHEPQYRRNLNAFLQRLEHAIPEWQAQLAPHRGEELLGYHNAWPYLMEFLDLKIERFLEPKPGIPPGPKHLAELQAYAAQRAVRVVVRATYEPSGVCESLAERIGGRVVLLCQNVGELPQASDYVALMDYNVKQLAQALKR